MEHKQFFLQSARQVSLACLLSMLYCLIILLNGTPALLFPVLLIVFGVVIVGVNRLFIRKSRTIQQIVILNAVCGALFFAGLLFAGGFTAFWQYIYGILAILMITCMGAAGVYGSVKLNSILLSMDGNLLLLIFSTLVLGALPHPFTWVLFAIIGAAAGLLGSISFRMGRTPGRREWGILLFLLAVIAVIAWLLFSFVVSPLSTGVVGFGQGAANVFVFLWEQITAFFRFLASLWHEEEAPADYSMEAPGMSGSQEAETGLQDLGILPVVIVAVIIAVILVIVILILKRTRKNKVKKQLAYMQQPAAVIHATPLRDALKAMWVRLRRRRAAKRYLASRKQMPEGLYFTLKHICRHSELKERSGDTPAMFLQRIRDSFEDAAASGTVAEKSAETKTEYGTYLEELIRQLNINFYAKEPADISYPWADRLVAAVKKQLRQRSETT